MMTFSRDYEVNKVRLISGEWEPEVLFSVGLLEQGEGIMVDGDDIRIIVANGRAHYRIVEREVLPGVCRTVLVAGQIIEPACIAGDGSIEGLFGGID